MPLKDNVGSQHRGELSCRPCGLLAVGWGRGVCEVSLSAHNGCLRIGLRLSALGSQYKWSVNAQRRGRCAAVVFGRVKTLSRLRSSASDGIQQCQASG